MVDKGTKGVINWKIVSVVLFTIFVQQLVCSLLYADSPFLIQTYFPGVCEMVYLLICRLILNELVTMLDT